MSIPRLMLLCHRRGTTRHSGRAGGPVRRRKFICGFTPRFLHATHYARVASALGITDG